MSPMSSRAGFAAGLVVASSLVLAVPAGAVLTSYTFNASSQAYTPLASPTTVIAGTNQTTAIGGQFNDTADGALRSIGFDFCLDGVTYNQFTAYTGGALTLGSSTLPNSGTPNSRIANDLATAAAYPVIAPWWDHQHIYDNGGAANGCAFNPAEGVHYQLSGVPPNRTLTVEWNTQVVDVANSFWWAGCGLTMDRYQAVLHEGTDLIEFHYGSLWASSGQATASTIGVAAGGANFLSATPTGGTASVSSVTSNNSIAQHLALIPNGTLYTFQPATKSSSTTTASGTAATVFGQPATITVTVAGTGTPGGTVYFLEGTTVLASAAVSGGQASTTLTLPVGAHSIATVYAGDCALAPSSASFSTTVSTASSLTTMIPPVAVVRAGSTTTFTANVVAVAPGAGVPTGSVTFLLDGAPWQTVPLAGGVASAVDNGALAPGSHTIAATYAGDGSFAASAAGPQPFLVLDASATVPALSSVGLASLALLLAASGLWLLKPPLA